MKKTIILVLSIFLVLSLYSCAGYYTTTNNIYNNPNNDNIESEDSESVFTIPLFELDDIQQIDIDTYAQGHNYFEFTDLRTKKVIYDVYKKNIDNDDVELSNTLALNRYLSIVVFLNNEETVHIDFIHAKDDKYFLHLIDHNNDYYNKHEEEHKTTGRTVLITPDDFKAICNLIPKVVYASDFQEMNIACTLGSLSDKNTIPYSEVIDNSIHISDTIMIAGDESLYYLQYIFNPGYQSPSSINCFEYNLGSKKSQLLYSASEGIDDSKDYFYASGGVYYVTCKDNNIELECYDLKENTFKTIEEYNSHIPSVTGHGDYITWYVTNENDALCLFGYQISTKEKFLIAENINAFSPYSVASISDDNLIAYITKDHSFFRITVYDLYNRMSTETYLLAYTSMISRIKANSKYIVYTDVLGPETVNCTTNIINYETGETYKLLINGDRIDVCDFILDEDQLSILLFRGVTHNGIPASSLYDIDLRKCKAKVYHSDKNYYLIENNSTNKLFIMNDNDGGVIEIR